MKDSGEFSQIPRESYQPYNQNRRKDKEKTFDLSFRQANPPDYEVHGQGDKKQEQRGQENVHSAKIRERASLRDITKPSNHAWMSVISRGRGIVRP